jgi:hypothetical protein
VIRARQANRDPFALKPGPESAEALRPMMGLHQVAWPFTCLGAESLDKFIGLGRDGSQRPPSTNCTVPRRFRKARPRGVGAGLAELRVPWPSPAA